MQKEREFYEVVIENKKLLYKMSRKIVDTSEGPKNSKWIFVLSTTRVLYIGTVPFLSIKQLVNIGICHLSIVHIQYMNHNSETSPITDEMDTFLQKSKGTFQHSSFLAGGATSAAGRLVVDNGILKVHGTADYVVLFLGLHSSKDTFSDSVIHFLRLSGHIAGTTVLRRQTSANS